MANIEALKEEIRDAGMTPASLARICGMKKQTMYNRMKTEDFRLSEIKQIAAALRFTKTKRDHIFFS